MKIISKISKNFSGLLPMLAIMLATASIETFCFFWLHQPDVPNELLKNSK